MAALSKVEITETQQELKQILVHQKNARGKERVQLLYLLTTDLAPSITEAALIIGRHLVTAQNCCKQY